jgi:hypothetical protein
MLWRSSLVVCVVSASLLDTGCSIYDHKILENAKQRALDHTSEGGRRAARGADLAEFLDPMIARVAAAGTPAAALPDAAHAAAALTERDAGSMQRTHRVDTLADDDAGVLRELADAGADIPPLVPEASSACRGRIGYLSQSGHCYFVHSTALSWHQSRDECRNLGAHLATITSEREQSFVARFQLETEIWIGLSKFGAPGFSWITNEELSFTRWEPDAPGPSQESAALIVPGTGSWSDRAPHELHPGLCEIERD